MSIITLKSNQVDGSDNILDEIAVNFNNSFLEGIALGPDSTLLLIIANIVIIQHIMLLRVLMIDLLIVLD